MSAARPSVVAARTAGLAVYVTILTVGYMISRGFATSGSRQPYTADDHLLSATRATGRASTASRIPPLPPPGGRRGKSSCHVSQ